MKLPMLCLLFGFSSLSYAKLTKYPDDPNLRWVSQPNFALPKGVSLQTSHVGVPYQIKFYGWTLFGSHKITERDRDTFWNVGDYGIFSRKAGLECVSVRTLHHFDGSQPEAHPLLVEVYYKARSKFVYVPLRAELAQLYFPLRRAALAQMKSQVSTANEINELDTYMCYDKNFFNRFGMGDRIDKIRYVEFRLGHDVGEDENAHRGLFSIPETTVRVLRRMGFWVK